MFNRPRAKIVATPPRKRRKTVPAFEEITFDPSARENYLTGFHKRKLQRIKNAKEEAGKKERKEKLAARKILRKGRKADLEKHVEAVKSMIMEQDRVESDSSKQEKSAEDDQWNGYAVDPMMDHKDEYVDEDRYTTVMVEAVDVSRDGLKKTIEDDESSQRGGTAEANGGSARESAGRERIDLQRGKRVWKKELSQGPKKRKKKFHYESKAERKLSRYKERSGNKEKAKARKH